MTRILVIQNLYPPHHYGGYELSCYDVVRRWRARGHEVSVLTSDHRVAEGDDGERGDDDDAEGPVWRRLPIALDHGGVFAAPRPLRRFGRERASQRALAEAMTAARPEVVSVWHMAGLSAGLLDTLAASGVPLVYVICDDWLTYAQRTDPWLRLFADRPGLARVARRVTGLPTTAIDLSLTGAFCFASDSTRQRSVEHTGWTFPRATVAFLGIDLDDFPVVAEPPAARPWRGRLLYVGRLDGRKGVDTAIRAVHQVPEAVLDLVGPGDAATRRRLDGLVNELGVGRRVTFTGARPRAELRDRYGAADVVLFPTEWDEPFGIVPLEAMACATPVIATGTGGSGEFLVDGMNCVTFEPGDAEGLAAAIRRLAADEELRRRVVSGGLRTAATLTSDALADTLEAWHVAARIQPA